MKLFGKKTLAMIMAIAMVLSVCVLPAYAGDGVTLELNETENLTKPAEAGEATVEWTSSAADKVSVDANGVIKGLKKGTATITAKWNAGTAEAPDNKSETWTVTVENGTVVSIDNATTLIVGKGANVETQLGNVELTATNASGGTFTTKTSSWEYNADAKTWTPAIGEVKGDPITITEEALKFKTDEKEGAKTFGKSTSKAVVLANLPTSITVALDNSKGGAASVTFTSSQFTWECASFSAAAVTTTPYRFVANISNEALGDTYATNGKSIYYEVSIAASSSVPVIAKNAVIDGDDDDVYDLDEWVEAEIEAAYKGVDASSATYDFQSGYYGYVNDSTGTYTVDFDSDGKDEKKLYEDGYLTDTIDYKATVSGVVYEGEIKLTLRTTDVAETFGYAGGSLSTIAGKIDTLLGGQMEAIEFEEIELDGGTLWEDNDFEDEVYDDTYYTPSELSAMYYLPNGSGEPSYLRYVAYDDYNATDDDVSEYADYIEGTIILNAKEFLLLSASITTKEVVEFSADEFEEAFLDLSDEYEELTYVVFAKPNSGDGYLYYEYDEDDSKHTSITASSSDNKKSRYYVEEEDGDKLIDSITYVPAKKTSGVVTIKFKAFGIDEDDDDVKNIEGIYQITVQEAADITIEAGKGEEVEIDPDLFQEYLEDTVGGKKDLTIVSVTISGAPRSKNAGYLITDGDELDKSGDKTFYADEEDVDVDDKKYDLNDLSFKGGTKATTTRAFFTIKYKVEGSKSTKTLDEGTIDFIVGSSHSLNGSIKAAQTMSFYQELDAFEALGDNDNVYVEFTSLPKNGKLYYNYGTANQEDVTIGTDYYLTTSAGKKQLRYVTFVPSYSSSKIAQTATFGVKGYNKNDKAVSGTVNVAVTYASYSAYFTDVKTSMYADSVDFLYNKGITTGMTTTTFGPDTNVTRGQFVTFLYRAAGQPAVTAANKFTDVKTSDYYYNAVRWAVQNGITNGRSATIFAPNANVTYQEIMTFLYRYDVTYLKHAGTLGSSSYVYDFNKVDTWAQNAVKWAVYKGIFTSGNLNPTTAGTRANVALYMHRMLTL